MDILQRDKKVEVEFKNRHWDFTEAVGRSIAAAARPSTLSQALPPGGKIGRYNENYVYVAALTRREEYEALLMNPNLVKKVNIEQYERLFSLLRGLYVVIGARPQLTKYLLSPPRQIIAADGIPTAHVLSGPTRGGEATYVSNNIHFIANVAVRLNYGKQTISDPRLVNLVSRYFDDAVRATLANVAVAIVGRQATTSSADEIEAAHEIERDVLSRPLLAKGELNFKRVPRDENALIAIFAELLGRGSLKGYHLYSLSQKAQYDGRAVVRLSNQDEIPTPSSDAELITVEFKLELRDLIDDFERERKFANDIQLIVVWDDTLSSSIVDYQVVGIENTKDADRAMDGVEKSLNCKRENRIIQMLVLNETCAAIGNGLRTEVAQSSGVNS